MNSTDTLDDLYIFSGESNIPLAQDICDYIGVPLRPTHYKRFKNDNLWIQLGESVREKDVYIIQSLSPPVQDYLVQLLMMLNVATTGGARRVTAVIPYYSYGRSDKKDAPRICITARLVADLITNSGADRVITMVLHSDQVHGFFGIPLDHLTSLHVLANHFKKSHSTASVVVSPDVGYAKQAFQLAKLLKLPMAIGSKIRLGDSEVVVDQVLGSGNLGKHAIIIDDEIATGGTMVRICETLSEKHGVEEFTLACTHGLFVGNAIERIQKLDAITEVVATDTVYAPHTSGLDELHVETVAPVLGEGILCNHQGQSVGDLFTFWSEGSPKEIRG